MTSCARPDEVFLATIAELAKLFPAAFSLDPARVRPLALGIRRDIFGRTTLPHGRVYNALQCYTRGRAYLAAMTQDAVRVDLDGNAAGTVSYEHAADAANRAKIRTRVQPKQPRPMEAPKHVPAPAGTVVRRLGLAELRQAAVARRATINNINA
jgi:sRNA-binding protein